MDYCFFINLFIWLHWAFVAARVLSLAAGSGGYTIVTERRLLIAVASLCGARALGSWASVVVARGLSCSTACGIFLDQGSNPCPLHWRRILNHCTTREVPDVGHF